MAVVASIALGVAGAASAQEALAKSSGCLNCHAVDTKKMGPAFKEVAAKYKGKADAEATLSAKISAPRGHPAVKASDDDVKAADQMGVVAVAQRFALPGKGRRTPSLPPFAQVCARTQLASLSVNGTPSRALTSVKVSNDPSRRGGRRIATAPQCANASLRILMQIKNSALRTLAARRIPS